MPGPLSAFRSRVNVIAMTASLLVLGDLSASSQEASRIRTALFDRAIQPGEVVRLDVTCDCSGGSATASVFGRDWPLFAAEAGWRGLIGIDLDVAPGTYPLAVVVERTGRPLIETTRGLIVVAKRFRVRRLSVPNRFVNPTEREMDRIGDEARQLQAVFETVTKPHQWHGAFQRPAAAPVNGSFGSRSVFNGQPRSPHAGVDFDARAGDAVTAPANGVVTLAAPLFFTGNTLVIDHGLGLYSLLAHLSEVRVKAGDEVRRGQVVGLVGATGRVTGPHLHWSVRLNGARVDPLSLIAVTKGPAEGMRRDPGMPAGTTFLP